jgi:hypothetical protein
MKVSSINKKRVSVVVTAAVGLCSFAVAAPALSQGIPKRVEQLEAQLAALQTAHSPVEVAVNCGAGETVGAALADHAEGKGKLTILVSGVCTESFVISRSNVSISGQGGAAVQSPAGTAFSIFVVANASNVTVSDLTISGSATAGVAVNQGAHAILRNATIHTAGSGAMALDNGVLNVTASTLRNNAQGAYAARGGVVNISNSTLHDNQVGAIAFKAGNIIFTSSTPDTTGGAGPVVRNNTVGAIARSGGLVELSDTTIENNTSVGILADSGGSVHLFVRLWNTGFGNRISGNPGTGLQLNKNSNLVVSDLTNVITGNGRGIFCSPSAGYVVPPGFPATVSGNSFGDIFGCTP